MNTDSVIRWTEGGAAHCARWRSESAAQPAAHVIVADDRTAADEAYGLACQGIALLWRGDFQNARQMLIALGNRAERHTQKASKRGPGRVPASPAEAFHLHRQARAQRARTLGALLVELDEDPRY